MEKMIRKIRLLLDIDGVLADFRSKFIMNARKEFPGRIFNLDDWKTYCPWENSSDLKITEEEFNKVYSNLDWENLGTVDTFEKFRELSHKVEFVRIVTARPKDTLEVTKEWLNEQGVHYDEIFIGRSKNKWKYCFDLTHVADDNDIVINNIIEYCSHMTIIPVPRIYNNQGGL